MTDGKFTIQLEVVGDTDSPADPATLGDIAHYTIAELRNENYSVQSLYTGQKGGNELFEIWKLVEQGATLAWQHQTEIATFVTTVSNIIVAIKNAQAKTNAKQNTSTSIKITLGNEKSGSSKVIEGSDPETIAKTVKELETEDPSVIHSGQAKMTTHVQQQSKRRRR